MNRKAHPSSKSSVSNSQYRIALAVGAAAAGLMSRSAFATPYASQVVNNGGTVSYYLNQGATDVTVIIDGVPHDMGSQGSGQQSFNLNGGTNYQIIVNNLDTNSGYNTFTAGANFGVGAVAQGGDDVIGTLFNLTGARSVAINQDPKSQYFGRIYLAQGGVGTSYTNPDLTNQVANNGGFTYSGSNSPFRLTVGPDDNVYMSDWSDAQSTIFVQDPNLNNNQTVLSGIGDTTNVNVHGSTASHVIFNGIPGTPGSSIQALDEDLTLVNGVPKSFTGGAGSGTLAAGGGTLAPAGSPFQSLWQWNLGTTAVNYNAAPTLVTKFPNNTGQIHGVTVDAARGGNGLYYMLIDRSDGTDDPSLTVMNLSGATPVVDWDSWTETNVLGGGATSKTIADALRGSCGIVVSPDNKELAIAVVGGAPSVYVVPLDSNGIPELQEARIVPVGNSANGRDVAFDAAGNITLADSGDSAAVTISPGGLTTTTYSNNAAGTNGSFTSTQLSPTWNVNSTGNFSDSSKWLMNYSPNMTGVGALFGSAITADTTINLDVSPTLGSITFNNSHSYTLSSTNGSSLNMNTFDPGGVQFNDLNGNHTIAVPVSMQANGTVYVANAGNTLTFSGGISTSNNPTFTMTGAGTAIVPSLNVTKLAVSGGTLRFSAPRANANTNQVTDLSVAAGATLDLGSNDLIDNYSNGGSADATRLSTIQALLKSGYNGGAWTGQGITSSAAAAIAASSNIHKTALGYTEASADAMGSHNGIGLDNDAIAIIYTYSGDATLDGTVDSNDFAALAANYGKTTGVGWIQGDFNYDGTVNALDFNALATNYGQTSLAASGDLPDAAAMGLGSIVPEPATLSLLGIAALGMTSRRRRRI